MSTNILYVSNVRMPTEKAHGVQIVRTIDALVKKGAAVTLVVPCRKNAIATDVFSFYGVERSFEVVYLPTPLDFLQRFLGRSYFSLSRICFGVRAFFHVMVQSEPIVYTRDLTLAFFLSVFSRKKVVFEDHEPRRSRKILYKFFLNHIDLKIVVARGLIELYRSYGIDAQRYTWIPNGVSIEDVARTKGDRSLWAREFGIPAGGRVVLYFGHFYAWKGVYTLIDAAQTLPPDASVVLIGGTKEHLREVRTYVSTHNISNVHVHDFMPQHEVIMFMKSADILVLPNTAKEERSNLYTTPIKLFEYMASGIPIVASDISSIRWYLEDGKNAALFTADDSVDLGRKVRALLEERDRGEALGRKAISDVRQFSWEMRAEKILDFIG